MCICVVFLQSQKGWLRGDVRDAERPGGIQEPDSGGHGASSGQDEGSPHRCDDALAPWHHIQTLFIYMFLK